MLYAAIALASSFNLVCTGTVEKLTYEGTTTHPYTAVYRVDLASSTWCEGDDAACKNQQPFAEVKPNHLKFVFKWPEERDEFRYVDQVDRETGEHQVLVQSGKGARLISESSKGTCQKTAFSGFPKLKPKF